MQTEDTTYNGWTNYKTWNVALWLSNDEGTYNHTRELAENVRRAGAPMQVLEGIWTREQAHKFVLADWLKDYVEESAPDLGASMFADLLNAAISEVDFAEIAENILSES